MKLLNLKLSLVENLAIDEALVDLADSDQAMGEVMRLWEPEHPMVVIGRSSPLSQEVNLHRCEQDRVPIFRRTSGGQSIVTGPGCLMYAVLLDYEKRPELRLLDAAHQFVMQRMLTALRSTSAFTDNPARLKMEGTCDLTCDGRKFSGNALRCKRKAMVYHGTMICNFDTALISTYLGKPKREPEYRNARSHEEFVTQLPIKVDELADAISTAWEVTEQLDSCPQPLQTITDRLVRTKYQSDQWLRKIP